MDKQILIIIPAYNESASITKTIQEVRSAPFPTDILVIDDGSIDDTEKKARAASVAVIRMPFNLGIGGAVQTGFKYAFQKGYDIAIQVDGDGQHDIRFLEALLAPVLGEEADVSVGSRFIEPFFGYQSSVIRRIGIQFFAHLISFLTGFNITDPTSGFRAYNKKAIAVFSKYYPVDFPEPESIVVAKRYGMKLKEVPVQMRERKSGNSSIRYLTTLYYMIKVTFAILLDILKPRKTVDYK